MQQLLLALIGNYILSGRLQAVAATTFSILLSLLLPPLAFLISGSVVALITLRKGAVVALQTLVASLLLLMVFLLLVKLPLLPGLAYALMICLPVCFAAMVLRWYAQQGVLLVAVGLMATVLVITIYMSIADVASWWQQWLYLVLEEAAPAGNSAQYKEILVPVISMVNAMVVAGLALNIIMSVLCGRWWQSRLFNPGAFQTEFHALRLPSAILPTSAIIVLLVFTLTTPWQAMFRDIMVVLMFLYLIQGIASIHRNVDKFKLSMAWLVSLYCLLIFWPKIALFIACLGMTDVYIEWRRRKIGLDNES